MRTPVKRSALVLAPLGLLLFLTACAPSAEMTCVQENEKTATYSITVTNDEEESSEVVRFHRNKSKLDFSRDGDERKLGPGESTTFSTTIKDDGEGTRHIGVFWPGPGGNDTWIVQKEVDHIC